MYQIKLSDSQYRDIIFALCVAAYATKKDAQNLKDLDLLKMACEAEEEVLAYQNLRAYLQRSKEVLL